MRGNGSWGIEFFDWRVNLDVSRARHFRPNKPVINVNVEIFALWTKLDHNSLEPKKNES